MPVPYDVFSQAFLAKITEYDFLKLEEDVSAAIIDGYMKAACAKFSKVCKYGLVSGDDVSREFPVDIDAVDLDEIVEIVSEGMVVQWMKPYVYKADNLENVLNTKDFYSYSPSELLLRVVGAYNVAKKEFTNMIREYSYNHGNLSDLSL